jgi:DNA-binding MarR family transcriptional regulator
MRRNRVSAIADTEAQPEPAFSVEDFLLYRLWVVSETASRIFASRYEREFGLTLSEWRVVAVLGESRTETTRRLIARSHMDRVRVSRAVIRLVDKGLVERQSDPDDQRAQVLGLTRRGMSIYRSIIPLGRSMEMEVTQSLTAAEIRTLNRLLGKMRHSLEVMDDDSRTVPSSDPSSP